MSEYVNEFGQALPHEVQLPKVNPELDASFAATIYPFEMTTTETPRNAGRYAIQIAINGHGAAERSDLSDPAKPFYDM